MTAIEMILEVECGLHTVVVKEWVMHWARKMGAL